MPRGALLQRLLVHVAVGKLQQPERTIEFIFGRSFADRIVSAQRVLRAILISAAGHEHRVVVQERSGRQVIPLREQIIGLVQQVLPEMDVILQGNAKQVGHRRHNVGLPADFLADLLVRNAAARQ